MRTPFLKLIALAGIALSFSACKKDEDRVIATEGVPPVISASASTIKLEKAASDAKVVTFSFTKPDFGYDAVVTNILQIAVKGTNFEKPTEASMAANASTVDFTGAAFNALVLKLGIETDIESDIELRIKSSISAKFPEVYSNVISMQVTPYASTTFVYVPGAYQGWDPSTANSLASATGNDIFEGIIAFSPGNLGFKIVTKRSWGPPEYGAGTAAGTIAVGGGDLTAPAAGIYKLVANLNDLTLSFAPYSFGVIGSATPGGWDTDTDMVYDNATGVWSSTLNLEPGVLKFRLNDLWETNFGGSNGTLAPNGSDITISSAGSYKLEMNIAAGTYSITQL